MAEERRVEVGADGAKRIVIGSVDRSIRNETNRTIRKIMEVIEKYTNYNELDHEISCIVRDTVLNRINSVVRVAKNKQTLVFGDRDIE